MKPDQILIRYGEIALKGKQTRRRFEQRLVANIQYAFDQSGLTCSVQRRMGRLYVSTKDIQQGLDIVKRIFGVSSVSPVFTATSSIDDMAVVAKKLFYQFVTTEKTFALRVRRSGLHEFSSVDVAEQVGGILDEIFSLHVDLTNPDFELFIEIRDNDSFLFTQKIRGPGGMPFGTQGKILSYIDNSQALLASWYLLKRGVSLIFLVESDDLKKKAEKFASEWFIKAEVIVREEDNDLIEEINSIVDNYNCSAVCLSHSLAENKETTMKTLQRLTEKISVPLLHPLITFSKDEIKKQAKLLGVCL